MSGLIVFAASVLTLAGIYAILTMILNLEAGWAGLWDLGLAGLVGFGAYVYVIVTVADPDLLFAPEWPMWAGILAASLATGIIAVLIAIPALRTRDEYFLITTFAFSVVILELIGSESDITGGAAGFNAIARPFHAFVDTRDYNFVLLGLVAVVAGLVYALLSRLGHSPFGRLLRAQRDSEVVALSAGKDIFWVRLKAFFIAGLLFGAVAPLYVWYIRSLYPHMFHATMTFTVWTALVVGGIGHLRGAALGALLLIGLTEATQFLQVSVEHASLLASLRPITIGIALILVIRFRPHGLLPERRAFARPRPARANGPDLLPNGREAVE
jgi:branched-chain amino acid transport system permease protein